MSDTDQATKLPLREERIQKIAAAIAGVPWHEWTRPFYIHPRRDALLKEAERVDNMLSFEPSQQSKREVRQIVERLGFDPTNHHNAAKCPYCREQSFCRWTLRDDTECSIEKADHSEADKDHPFTPADAVKQALHRTQVTDDEVDRACQAWFSEYEGDGHGWEWRKSLYGDKDHALVMMRRALEAARNA